MKRYLALAEGYSGDDHYGKTTYGVIRYGRDPVVAVLDSTRARGDVEGVPVVGDGRRRARVRADRRARRRRRRRGRLPPAWRGILRDAIDAGLDVEAGMHEFLADDPELVGARARAWRRAPRLPPPARRPQRPDRREPHARRCGRPHRRLRLRGREEDRRRRARPRGAGARPRAPSSCPRARRGS